MIKIRWRNIAFRRLFILVLLTAVLIVAAILAPWLAPNDAYKVDMRHAFLPPGAGYPLGTDNLGRCVLSRILYGARTTLFSALAAAMLVTLIGTAAGILSGYAGGMVDAVLMKLTLIFQAFPGFILAVAIAGILGGSTGGMMLSIILVYWTRYARMARSMTLKLAGEDYVKAARVCGASRAQVMVRHILPNIISPMITMTMMDISGIILYMAGLSFLGMGTQKPSAEWGLMMSEARAYLQLYPGQIIFPGLALLVSVILFNLLGDSIRDYLDTRTT